MIDLVFAPIWTAVGAMSGLSIVDPERAFRYENIFQLRSVELSSFGVFLQVAGGVIVLLVGPFLIYGAGGWIGILAFFAGALGVIGSYQFGDRAAEAGL